MEWAFTTDGIVTISIAALICGLCVAWLLAGKRRTKRVSRLEEMRLAGREAADAPITPEVSAEDTAPSPVAEPPVLTQDEPVVEELPPLTPSQPTALTPNPSQPKSPEQASAMSIAAALVRHDVRTPEPREARPSFLNAPRAGTPDDLTRIKGVGARLEAQLNEMGYYHLDQIAEWSEEEVAWIDDHLDGFKGRASLDQWVSQAQTLLTAPLDEKPIRMSQRR